MLWYVANYGPLPCNAFLFCTPPLSSSEELDPFFHTRLPEISRLHEWMETLITYRVTQHTQLNLFLASNAVSRVINVRCSRGLPPISWPPVTPWHGTGPWLYCSFNYSYNPFGAYRRPPPHHSSFPLFHWKGVKRSFRHVWKTKELKNCDVMKWNLKVILNCRSHVLFSLHKV